MIRSVSALLAVLTLSPAASAQWDSIPHESANPVTAAGFVVVHENAAGVHAFSSMSRKWTPIAPPGASIEGVGDWCVLTQDSINEFTGYSARMNASSTQLMDDVVATFVDDDVALVVASIPGFGFRCAAYSAQFNTWDIVSLGPGFSLSDIAVSRFVIGLKEGNVVHGFAARVPAWSTTSTVPPIASLVADGNVLVADATSEITAFSGIRGTWAAAPTPHPIDNLMVDHNVAYLRALNGLDYNACGYSAYNAAWVTSSVLHFFGTATEAISDNVVRVQSTDPLKAFEAFGARPGAAWDLVTGTIVPLALEEDYTVVEFNVRRLYGFSGVCGGTWQSETTCGPSIPLGTPAHLGVFEEGPLHHFFRPADNTWDPPTLYFSSPPVNVTDATWDVRQGTFQAHASRWSGLSTGPAVPPDPFAVTSGGSFIAHQQLAGAGVGDVYLYDERCDEWPAPFNPGVGATLVADRNALVAHFGTTAAGPVWGYSVQRADWTSPAAVTPLTLAPTVEENVAWLVDGAGDLWGFSTPNEGHVWHQWPNGTEYHVSGGGNLPFLGYSVVGDPTVPEFAFTWASLNKIPGLLLPPIAGLFCLDPSPLFTIGPLGFVDASCLVSARLPVGPAPTCFQVWLQSLLWDSGTGALRWAERCDPGWFF